ncbi:MAG: PD40 domain-containing protein [Saccharospirillaceae bacterium]|nr:PD40 domain-containing protein [Saccharospirillaceae bacterium]
MIKFFRNSNEEFILSEIGKDWIKPSFRKTIFHPSIIVFFLITLFSISLFTIALSLPIKKAFEQTQTEKVEQQLNNVVDQLNYSIKHNLQFIKLIVDNSDEGKIKDNLIDLAGVSGYNHLVEDDDVTQGIHIYFKSKIKITSHTESDGYPAVSPDGKSIDFYGKYDGNKT